MSAACTERPSGAERVVMLFCGSRPIPHPAFSILRSACRGGGQILRLMVGGCLSFRIPNPAFRIWCWIAASHSASRIPHSAFRQASLTMPSPSPAQPECGHSQGGGLCVLSFYFSGITGRGDQCGVLGCFSSQSRNLSFALSVKVRGVHSDSPPRSAVLTL